MNCTNYSKRTGCRCCQNFLKTQQVVVDGGNIVLLVAEDVFDNFESLCLCIAQSIPSSSENQPVFIQSGITNTTRYPLLTTEGATVYSYQLRPRTLYKIMANTAAGGFMIRAKYLCKTTNILNRTPTTAAVRGGNTQ